MANSLRICLLAYDRLCYQGGRGLIPDDMEFQSGDMPNYTTSDGSVKIQKDSEVRLKIIGTRVDATEIMISWESLMIRGKLRSGGCGAELAWSPYAKSGPQLMWAINQTPSLPPKSHSRPLSNPSPAPPTSSSALKPLSRNTQIQLLSKQGHLKQALHLLSQERNPTQLTYELLILACARRRSPSDAALLRRRLIDDGFDQDPFLATKLINMYSELGSLSAARCVFDETLEKTIYVWNALLRALAIAGLGEEALALYSRMHWDGVAFDRFTFPHVLKACVAPSSSSIFLLMEGMGIHGHILRRGFQSHLHSATTLIDFYAKYGRVLYARRVFDRMPERNVVSWSAMIACYSKNNRPYEALELFREMMTGTQDDDPNSVTMVSVLQACSTVAALGQGKVIHAYILRRGLDAHISVANALIALYVKCGSLELGRLVFDQLTERDVVSWNSMISGYAIHGFGREAIRVFEEMTEAGISPSPITFVSVLGACSHIGLVGEGKNLFESMITKYNIVPCAEHYSCMVDLLGRAGRLYEAAEIIEMMPLEPGPTVWGSLIGACRIHGNIELAERACQHLFELEPLNAGNYVLLADIYAGAKMWEDVNRVKMLLESRRLRKVPGCCWIEVKKKVYSFVSVDELNPQIEELHALLVQILTEMKDEGYIPDSKIVLYDLDKNEKEQILLGHSEKLAVAFGLINTNPGETIRITKNLSSQRQIQLHSSNSTTKYGGYNYSHLC
ncbi:Pentatricopeptide repeat-containing protein crr2, chloroplastic [Asimina triloba]